MMKFVGRDYELEKLQEWLLSNQFDDPQLAVISGPDGVGKFFLIRHWIPVVKKQSVRFAIGLCKSKLFLPYSPFDQIIKQLQKFPEVDQELIKNRWLPSLKYITSNYKTALNTQLRERIVLYREILLFIQYIKKTIPDHAKPLVFIIEDFERTNRCTKELIIYLIKNISNSAIKWLITTTYQDQQQFFDLFLTPSPAIFHPVNNTKLFFLHMEGLHDTDILEGFPEITDANTQELLCKITEKYNGNPLFITEILIYFIMDIGITINSSNLSLELLNTELFPNNLDEIFEFRYRRLDKKAAR